MLDVRSAQRVLDDSPFGPWWGFVVEAVDDGRARVRLPVRPELFRPGGVLQGGCAMTLADVTFWLAIMTRTDAADPALTLEQTSVFLGAARTELTCDAELVRAGRTVVYGTATVHQAAGLVSHHTLTYLRPALPTAS